MNNTDNKEGFVILAAFRFLRDNPYTAKELGITKEALSLVEKSDIKLKRIIDNMTAPELDNLNKQMGVIHTFAKEIEKVGVLGFSINEDLQFRVLGSLKRELAKKIIQEPSLESPSDRLVGESLYRKNNNVKRKKTNTLSTEKPGNESLGFAL